MTKSKSTKKALLLSMLSILVCVAMLIGSTFAWFTDSVSTGKNKIVAGNLDVELYQIANDGKETKVEATTSLFDDAAKWEPGHTEMVYLKVANIGSLALDYKFAITAKDNAAGKNSKGEAIVLSDFLKFAVVPVDAAKALTRDEAIAIADANAQPIATGYSSNGKLLSGEDSGILALVVYMPTTVGNDANAVTERNPLYDKYPELVDEYKLSSVELGVSLIATQTPYENDSFGNKYDEFLPMDITAEDLKAVIENAKPGETIKLNSESEIILDDTLTVNTPGVTIDFNGAKVSQSKKSSGAAGIPAALRIDAADVTVKNAVITGTSDYILAADGKTKVYDHAVYVNRTAGDVTIEGCTITRGGKGHSIWINDGYHATVTIKNNTITGPISYTDINEDCTAIITGNTLKVSGFNNAISLNNKVTNLTFTDNTITGGYAIRIMTNFGAGSYEIKNITVRDNKLQGSAKLYMLGKLLDGTVNMSEADFIARIATAENCYFEGYTAE